MSGSASRFRLNAPGDFYVEDGVCIACGAPESVAPDLMAHSDRDDEYDHCYFRRQPRTSEEVEQAIRAVYVSCCEGVRYCGSDPDILARLEQIHRQGGFPHTA